MEWHRHWSNCRCDIVIDIVTDLFDFDFVFDIVI